MSAELVDIMDLQTEIITTQAECIDALFLLLCRYMDANEIAKIPTVDKITEVARLMERLREVESK